MPFPGTRKRAWSGGSSWPAEVTNRPVFAYLYGRFVPTGDKTDVAAHRDEPLAGLYGRVIEVGAGSGLCFAHYPDTVDELVAVEPELHLRGLAEEAAVAAPVPVRVLGGSAD